MRRHSWVASWLGLALAVLLVVGTQCGDPEADGKGTAPSIVQPWPSWSPIPAPTPSPSRVGRSRSALRSWRDLPEPWRSIVYCESVRDESWRPQAASRFRGYFQFLPSTWRGVGGHGDPANASLAEQFKRAKILRARDGLTPWPVCGRPFR